MPPEVRSGPVLAARTTLRVGGRAMAEVVLSAPEDADGLDDVLQSSGATPLVLGGGSNILAADGELPLVVVSPRLTGEPVILRERPEDKVRVRVLAGVKLQRLLAWLATQGLSALEGLAGVPGTVGGAVAGNAGSYGDDMAGALARVLLWTPEGGRRWIGRDGFVAAYRRFDPIGIEGLFLVLAAEFDCEVREPIAMRQEMTACLRKKRATQPITAATAGCVFKNPSGGAAWRLLADAGFQGRRIGNMAFSSLHANFLVNCGGGTGRDALELITMARETVRTRTGYVLEPEVRIVP